MSWWILITGIILGIMSASAYPDLAVKINEVMLFVLNLLFDLIKDRVGDLVQ